MHLVHRLRRERPAGVSAAREEMLIQVVEVFGPKRSQRHVTDPRQHVVRDDPRVAMRGRRSDMRPLTWQPRLGDEPTERKR